MTGYALILMVLVVMFMGMRMGADSPSSILAAIRIKKER